VIDVAIIGASGYTGLELIKILINHPRFNITYIANSEGDTNIEALHPSLLGIINTDVDKANITDIVKSSSLVFLALPHKTSMNFVSKLLDYDIKVVDLSGDYRLELNTYEKFYTAHIDKNNLQNAVYGLPEYYKDKIKKSSLVANPGCYPTATLLALLPFIDYIDTSAPIFIDAKSGVSGAGKKLSDNTSYVNINENIFAYTPIKHRHSPEIAEKILKLTDKSVKINFIPHLIPITRGMLISIYATLKDNIEPIDILKDRYKNENMIRVRENPVTIKDVAGTNYCDIFATTNDNAIFINSSIDNLLRGASSQAVVNANILCDFNEDMGINHIAYVP